METFWSAGGPEVEEDDRGAQAMSVLTDNSPWLLLSRSVANQNLGLPAAWPALTSRHAAVKSSSLVVAVLTAGHTVVKDLRIRSASLIC